MSGRIRRSTRSWVRAALLSFMWSNRNDVVRWAKFLQRAASRKTRPTPADLKLEATVRANVSADRLLRTDPSLRDLRVHDGIVVLESPAEWHNRGIAITRIGQVKGVESVQTAADVEAHQWNDIGLIDYAVSDLAV
jgi:hypothetical protein